jgi:hypothetical protein
MEMGSHTNISFSGDKYESVYECMKALMDELQGNTYHRRKFERLLKTIAMQGRLVINYSRLILLIELVIECIAHQREAIILYVHSRLHWIRRVKTHNVALYIK